VCEVVWGMAMEKLVVIRIGEGSFEQGFPVTLDIGEEGDRPHTFFYSHILRLYIKCRA